MPAGHAAENGMESAMTETTDDVIAEALAVIDRALGGILNRELVSSDEVADLLLDVRSLLVHDAAERQPLAT
jgi:hypothetical protein